MTSKTQGKRENGNEQETNKGKEGRGNKMILTEKCY